MCGAKKASKVNNPRGLYINHGIGKDEHGYYWGGLTKQQASHLLRARLQRELEDEIIQAQEDMEQDELERVEELAKDHQFITDEEWYWYDEWKYGSLYDDYMWGYDD